MRNFVLIVLFLSALCLGALFLGRRGGIIPTGKIQVVATIFPLANWLHDVGGPDVEIHCLVSGATNPHHFEPSLKDATQVSHAQAIFAVGLDLDPWAKKLWTNSGNSETTAYFETGTWIEPRKFGEKTIALMPILKTSTAHAAVDEEEHHHHAAGSADPHFWLDPARAQIVTLRMGEELSKLDPAHRDEYQRRALAYVEKLKALDEEISKAAQEIPPGRKIVTFHDAYGYLLERLGVNLAAVVQVNPGIDPSPRNIAEALRVMRDIGQRTVFTEPGDNAGAAKTVAAELDGDVQMLDPMDTEASTIGNSYIERLQNDIAAFAKSLKAQAK